MEAAEESQFSTPSGPDLRPREAVQKVVTWSPALLSGLILRLWMLKKVDPVAGDSLVYESIARNMLSGHYSHLLLNGNPLPTLIRLPGYPIFMATCFKLFGTENHLVPLLIQVALELAGCVLLADFASRVAPKGMKKSAGQATLWLASLCPFTASYAVMLLAESLTLFMVSLALWTMERFVDRPRWQTALCFTFAVTYGAMLRPDGVLVAAAFVPPLIAGAWVRRGANGIGTKQLARMALVCCLLAVAPFAVWTWRNWSVFHVFQPLAPRLANDPGEEPNLGWERWVKTWCLDWKSTYEIYWYVPDDKLDVSKLPSRAFDSAEQYDETVKLANDYNKHRYDLTRAIDAGFARLAEERIAANPWRYYVWLPLGRLTDMWLRPRVENLNIDRDWWAYSRHRAETRFSWFYTGLNLIYLGLAALGVLLRPRFWKAMLAYILLRSALLLTVEAPETRYTIECFPIIFVFGGIALYRVTVRVCLSIFMLKASDGRD